MVSNKRFFILLFVMSIWTAGIAQQNRYFIKFRNKDGNGYSISQPEKFLSKASLERRKRYNIPIHPSDLPVTASYIQQVQAVPGTRVHYALKWMNGVVVSFNDPGNENTALSAIEALPFVESSGKVRRVRKSVDPESGGDGQKLSGREQSASFDYGGSKTQVFQMKLECLHDKNYRGQGMTIAVLDAGFSSVPSTPAFDSLRAAKRLLGGRDFVDGGTNVYRGGDHGTMVLSCMAALIPGNAIGTAPYANYWLIRTEEGGRETISEEYNWIRGAEFADSVGADILTTSLGYTLFEDSAQNHSHAQLNGRTAPMSIASTMAARKGMFVLNAAGNDGDQLWRKIGVPGDADSICTVGSVTGAGIRSSFSSMGPTADNRIKPDLMAMGEQSWVCSGEACWPGNGTSFATPVLAGAVACYWQANRSLNNIAILEKLRQRGSLASKPDTLMGWGIPDLCDSAYKYYIPPAETLPPVPSPFTFEVHAHTLGLEVELPVAEYEHIEVKLYDMLGKLIYSGSTKGITASVILPAPYLQAGMYVLSVETSEGSARKKMLKLGL